MSSLPIIRSAPIREFEIIADIFAPLATAMSALGLKDDVALIGTRAGSDLVLTTDTIVEGIDFFADDPADAIAKKALRVNLSDLAAKGAKPFGYLSTLVLPARVRPAWIRKFASGLKADQKNYGIALLGGDMSSTSGPLCVSITALGRVPSGKAILRSGAKAGDVVFVTGTIGDSGGGLASRNARQRDKFLLNRYRLPQPRVLFGQRLRGLASAAIDVSDGLLADLGHIAAVSKVQISVDLARVPVSKALQRFWGSDQTAMVRAATAGDDYELAFTASPDKRAAVVSAAKRAKTPVSEIGSVRQGKGVVLLGRDGRPIKVKRAGWEHF